MKTQFIAAVAFAFGITVGIFMVFLIEEFPKKQCECTKKDLIEWQHESRVKTKMIDNLIEQLADK